MSIYYILIGKEVKPVDNVLEWAKFYELCDRKVRRTEINQVVISTVFLGIDYSFEEKIPLLFETMIFGGINDGYQTRYSTWDEAIKGHELACEKVRIEMT